MAGSRKSGGGNTVVATRKRRSGGGWVALSFGRRRVAGAWVDLLSLMATPANVSGFVVGPGVSGAVTSSPTNITGFSGAVSWAYLSGNTTMTCNSPSGTSGVTWTATVSNGIDKASVWRCTNGGSFVDVSVLLQRSSDA